MPGRPTWPGLTWQPPTQVCDPLTGIAQTQRGGLVWTAGYTPSQQVVQRVWRPNVVAQQVSTVSYCPEQVTVQVPVQVCKMVTEEQVRQVPVQVCRMVQEEYVRKVPYQTCRQVVERVPRQEAVQVCRMVTEEQVRQVPVTTCRMVQEEKRRAVPGARVQMGLREADRAGAATLCGSRCRYTYTFRVPRTVMVRVPVGPCEG